MEKTKFDLAGMTKYYNSKTKVFTAYYLAGICEGQVVQKDLYAQIKTVDAQVLNLLHSTEANADRLIPNKGTVIPVMVGTGIGRFGVEVQSVSLV